MIEVTNVDMVKSSISVAHVSIISSHVSSGKQYFYSLTSALPVSRSDYRVDPMLNALRIAFCILPGTLQSPII
jgi:hypothetical protein